jgi:hypothetical protein
MNIQLRPPYFKCCLTEAASKTTSFGHVTPHLLYLPPCNELMKMTTGFVHILRHQILRHFGPPPPLRHQSSSRAEPPPPSPIYYVIIH